ncbi:phage tail tape measure protein, partial [Streptococcus pneumoniae]
RRLASSVLPATHTEIAAVAEAAGQLGIKTPNVVGFTKTMIDMGESTNLSAEQAATQLARFSNIMGTNQTDIGRLGAAVVGLGNNFATTESEIVDTAMRIAGAGRQANMSEGDVLGLAAALSSVGIEAEAGGTAVSMV